MEPDESPRAGRHPTLQEALEYGRRRFGESLWVPLGFERHPIRIDIVTHHGVSGDDLLARAIALFGSPGAGKTRWMRNLFLLLLKYPGVAKMALDLKGDLFYGVLETVPEEDEEKLLIVDLASDLDRGHAIAPFDLTGVEELPLPVQARVRSLHRDYAVWLLKSRTKDWGERFGRAWETLVEGILLRCDSATSYSLVDAYLMLQERERLSALARETPDPLLRRALERVAAMSDHDLGPLERRMEDYVNNPLLRGLIAAPRRSTIDFSHAISPGAAILTHFAESLVGPTVARVYGNAFFLKTWLALQLNRATIPVEQRPLFFLLIDEFQFWGR